MGAAEATRLTRSPEPRREVIFVMSARARAAASLVALSGPPSAAEPRRRQTRGALDLTVCCGKSSSSNSTTPTTPSPVATREVTVLDFDDCIHLGDDVGRICAPAAPSAASEPDSCLEPSQSRAR